MGQKVIRSRKAGGVIRMRPTLVTLAHAAKTITATMDKADVKISVITPTVGRASLRRTALSVVPQLGEFDEWFVVGDGRRTDAEAIVKSLDDARVHYSESPGTALWGNRERDIGISQARGDRLVFVDDDDELTPEALDLVRRAHALQPTSPLVFRMELVGHNDLLWTTPEVRSSNIGTPMFVPLNDRSKLPRWMDGAGHGYASDFIFIRSCCERQGAPVFFTNVICRVHHVLRPPPRRRR
jgi:glycosyltransferase involved in cell wall biosynthesis